MSTCLICACEMGESPKCVKERRFCSDPCRANYHKICRQLGDEMIRQGVVSVAEVRRRAKDMG